MAVMIRRAVEADTRVIAEYNCQMAMETEAKQLHLPTVEIAVQAVFHDERKGFYLVAESEEKVIGQLMITYEWSDWRNGWFWWIQSVYVHADHRKQGVFRSLFAGVLQEAKIANEVIGIRLYVETENLIAQRTYKNLGFEELRYHLYQRTF